MYTKSAELYDAMYKSIRDFDVEAAKLRQIIDDTTGGTSKTLLEIACGTGLYLRRLDDFFKVEGSDLSPHMLAVARAALPDVPFHEADMVELRLDREFDVVLCLGSSIGYVRTVDRLRQTILNFAAHTRPGGVVIVEPWFPPEVWDDTRVTADLFQLPDLKIARMLISGRDDRVSTLDAHHLVARGQTVDSFVEHHELGLFTKKEHLSAFANAGLSVRYDPVGLLGRGLYVAVKDG